MLYQKYDLSNQGILDVANFKTVLMRSKIGLAIQDINRIVRFLDQEKFMMIDYINFLKKVKDSGSVPVGRGAAQHVAEFLKAHLKYSAHMNNL